MERVEFMFSVDNPDGLHHANCQLLLWIVSSAVLCGIAILYVAAWSGLLLVAMHAPVYIIWLMLDYPSFYTCEELVYERDGQFWTIAFRESGPSRIIRQDQSCRHLDARYGSLALRVFLPLLGLYLLRRLVRAFKSQQFIDNVRVSAGAVK